MQLLAFTPADSLGLARGAHARRPLGPALALAALLVVISCALAPSVAAAAACPSADTSYMGNCGPQFAVPNWTDAGGWTDPAKYSTIQLADVNGDGSDELIARADDGVEIFWFDTTFGQWRPQVDSGGNRQALTDFASPPPWEASDPHSPAQPQYYSTIQAADIDGQPGEEILARFWDGMRTYKYSPPAGGNDIDGGTWTRIGTSGPFSDADGYGDPALYSTIQVGQFYGGDPPMLIARVHSQPGAQSLAFYTWQNGTWSAQPGFDISGYSDQECGQPACYLDLKATGLPGELAFPAISGAVIGRDQSGIAAFGGNDSGNVGFRADADYLGSIFADSASTPDCPFSTAGATGPGSGDCLGSSPSYYETLQVANIDGQGGDELLARAADGLRVRYPEGGSPPFAVRSTLTALAGAASSVPDGLWGSIRTGDINDDAKDEVLALDGKALQAWSYDPVGNAWSQLQPSTPLALASDPWLSHPEYYSTIQIGDVDGDKRDDVVARGPSGIRTWFYNRRGTGGWERYVPEGYPAFPTPGQQAAFTALTELAKADNVIPTTATSVRDVWASENAPQTSDLTALLGTGSGGLGTIAGCSGAQPGNPPQYQTCTPPPPVDVLRSFTVLDWTAVVNEMLSEAYAASQVVAFFSQLESMREDLFIAEGAELPAIGHDLGMQVAAGSTAQFNVLKFMSTAFGIMGSVAGLVDPAVGAPLSVAAYVLSAIPAGSPLANSTFETTYAGLQDQFAEMVTEVDKAMLVQSQEVRQDGGLLSLVGQLSSRGTWTLDTTGAESAASQGFALWAYRSLLPTIADRYQINHCYSDYNNIGDCTGPTPARGIIGSNQKFTMAGQQYQQYEVPCTVVFGRASQWWTCVFSALSDDIMNRIWNPITAQPDCIYQPGQSQTAWTFSCPAGDDVNMSVGQNTWQFNSYCGNFVPQPCSGAAVGSGAVAAQARRGAPIRLGRPRHGRRGGVRGRARLRAEVGIHPRLALAGARVKLNRLLFERRGRGELTRPRGSRAPRPLKLRRTGPHRFVAAAKSGRPRARIVVRRLGRRRASLTLTAGAAAFRAPRACHALPAQVAIETPPLELETRLFIADGRRRQPIVLHHPMRCRRDARGNIDRLIYIRNRRHRLRPGLAVTLRGPRRVQAGTTATYLARVHNRRRRGARLLSSLWDVTLTGGGRTTRTRRLRAVRARRIRELRTGRSRRLILTLRVPRTARGRVCVQAVAGAPGARAAQGRVCSRIQAAGGPASTTG